MKKKLLITLGCSYTEGVGCYDPVELNKTDSVRGVGTGYELYNKSLDRFHNFGWPPLLQKKLQYDSLWNLGHGGASNSQLVKRWMELFADINLSEEYDVLVLWMVTLVERISFYKNGKITSFNPNHSNYSEYIKLLGFSDLLGKNINKDITLETYFCINTIQNICNLSKYNFLYINVDNNQGKSVDSLMKSSSSLNFQFKEKYPDIGNIVSNSSGKNKAFCGHPNEQGYEDISEMLFQLISQYHPHLLNNQEPPEYTMKYLGTPRQW